MPDINDVFNYVMDTPDNTNPNVLRSMLNSLEGGGSGGGTLKVTITSEEVSDGTKFTMDKTWQEIANAFNSGNMPYFILTDDGGVKIGYAENIYSVGGYYGVSFNDNAEILQSEDGYYTDSANGYPSFTFSRNES